MIRGGIVCRVEIIKVWWVTEGKEGFKVGLERIEIEAFDTSMQLIRRNEHNINYIFFRLIFKLTDRRMIASTV